MKLYFSPGACSLADHIALHEAGFTFDRIKTDLKTKQTETGEDFTKVNPKGYVPTLVLDDGAVLTENVAILDWIASQNPALSVHGTMGRTRLLETLAFVSTEIHKQFKPIIRKAAKEDQDAARELITKRLSFLAERLKGDYLFGRDLTVADCYLFVMLVWAAKYEVTIPKPLQAYAERMKTRPAVKMAFEHEGLAA